MEQKIYREGSCMKVLVIGADSEVGEFVIRSLVKHGHEAAAVLQAKNKMEDIRKAGAAEVYAGDQAIEGYARCEAIIFLSDSSPNTGAGKTVLVDHEAVADAIQEAKQHGVNRFVMMSAVRANEEQGGSTKNVGAKGVPDELLEETGLVYTVVRPARMTDKPGKGAVTIARELSAEEATISKEDTAAMLVAVLDRKAAYNKKFDVASGDTPIPDALQSL